MTNNEILRLIEVSRQQRKELQKDDPKRLSLTDYIRDLRYTLSDRKAAESTMLEGVAI